MIYLYTPAPSRSRDLENRKRALKEALKSTTPLPKWAASEALDLNIEGQLHLNSSQLNRIAQALKSREAGDLITKGGYQDVPMSRRRAQLLAEYAERLATMLENAPDDKDLAEWVQSKIDRAASSIQSAYHYLDQEDDLEKGAGHRYTHRKLVGRDPKTGRARYRYYYQEHHGGGITRAKLEEGSAFKLTFKGRRGHFHIESVQGDIVTVKHDGRANSKPVQMSKAEFRALIKRQHGQALASHTEKLRRQVDRLKRNPTRKRSSLGLALHRLRQAAEKAGVTLPEEYQRKPKKKTRVKRPKTAVQGQDNFDTMPEVEDLANKKTSRERSLALRGYKPENLIEIAAHAFLQDKAVNEEVDAKVRELEREYKDLANTEARLGSEEELAKEGGFYRYQDAEQATREKREEIQNLLQARIDIYNKVYRSVVLHLRDQKTNYVERRKAIQSRIKELTVSVDTSETMPTARDQLTSTAQEIITEADQDHDERHDEHQSIEQFELGEHTHTRTGVKLFTAKQKGRTDRDEYRRRVEIAKKHNGRYERRYVKGFLFKTAEDARNFALEVEGGQVEESAETVTPHEDHPQADNFETMVEVESAPVQTTDIRTPILRAVEQATPAHPTGYSSDTRGALTIGGFNAEVYGYPTKKEAVADARAKGHKVGDVVPVSNRFWTGYAISRIDPTTKERVFFDKTSAESKAIKVPLADKATHQKRGHLFHEGGDIRTIRRVQGADNLETMPEPDPSPARQALTETADEIMSSSTSALNIDQANAQDTLTENRTRNPESKATDKGLIESARELAKTSERGDEIRAAVLDLMNAQQLKRYKRATGETGLRAEDMIEKRRAARERLRGATSGATVQGEDRFDTMPEVEKYAGGETNKQRVPRASWRSRMVSYNKVDSIMEGKTPSRLPLKTQAQFKKIENLIIELEQMEQQRTKSGRLKDWQGIKAKREEILNARRVLLQKYASERTRTQHSALQDHTFLSYYKPAKSTATPEDVRDKHGDRRSDLRTLRRYFETHEPDQQGQLTEAAETLDTRSTQQKTFTPEIQTAIESLKSRHFTTRGKSYPLETYLKTRKDGGIYRTTETPTELADKIAENLPENIASEDYNIYDFREDTLRALIARAINEGVEARETPAELKDRIGSVITQRAQDNAASQKAQITGEGQRKALREMRRNISTLTGDGYFDEYRRGGERSYMGLGAIEKTLNMSERLNNLYVDAIFRETLPPELERFKMPLTRFSSRGADEVSGAFANKYETVGEIRDNISTIREQMRETIKSAVNQTSKALAGNPYTLRLINQSYEKATERLNTDRQKNIENARALAQYTDDPQAHLAEIQELERQSDQAIAEQVEINREFANAYIHEASDLVERALESTKGEVIDSVMSVKTPKNAGQFTAKEQGKANRKLMARIFNEVFEQVRREIGDEPIERGEKHPRNIADTVKKPSKTPAQFREDIKRADEDKRMRARAKREARRARRTQKSALHLTNYRSDLYRTIERLAS